MFILCLILLSQASTLIRYATAPSLAICFWRLLIAAVLLSPLALNPARRKEAKTLSHRDWGHLLFSSFFLFAHFYFFFLAVQDTSVATSTILFSLNPVSTAVGAFVLFRHRITWQIGLSCLVGLLGVAVLFFEAFGQSATPLEGALSSVVSAICFSGYILTGKRVRTRLANSTYTFAIYLLTAIYAAGFMLALRTPFTGYSQTTWFAFLGLAIFPTLLGHALFTHCLAFMDINFMSCMTLTEPILAEIAAIWLFRERLTIWAILGFLLTAISVVILYLKPLRDWYNRRRRRAKEAKDATREATSETNRGANATTNSSPAGS